MVQTLRRGGLVGTKANVTKVKGYGHKELTALEKDKTLNISSELASKGGKVDKKTGVRVSGLGKDAQLTALTPNEFVLTPKAAEGMGIDTLLAINEAYGGTNAPEKAKLSDVSLMSGGGIVAGAKKVLGKEEVLVINVRIQLVQH